MRRRIISRPSTFLVQWQRLAEALWLGVCGGADYFEHLVGLGKHGDVTALQLMGGRFHALRKKTFQIRMNGAVVLADDVPARLRLPCGSPNFRLEQVGFRDALGRPNELLLLLRKVSAEKLRA